MIVAAAYRMPSGLIVSLPRPAFHKEVRQASATSHSGAFRRGIAVQGYVTDAGVFLPLDEAVTHAECSGQVQTLDGVKTIHWGDQSGSECK